MYQTFCQTLFHMTWTAAAAALAVMVLRLVFKKAPRSLICGLWLVVFLRMVCPVSFTLPVSLVPEPPAGIAGEQLTILGTTSEPVAAPEIGEPHNYLIEPDPESGDPGVVITRTIDPYPVLTAVWAAGFAAMLLWDGVSYVRLRRRVADAVRVEDNVYESDRIDSPFVCGVLRPRIYLPAGLDGEDRQYVLLHEGAHIARGDPLWKLLAWLALSVHWFNPVLWPAYLLYGRDVETACDQRVIRGFDRADVAGYAAALLHLGRRNAVPRAVPLAFGEENVKGRIKHVMDFKRPRLLVLLAAAVVCVAAGVLLLANPGQRNDQLEGVQMTDVRVLDQGIPVELPQDLIHEIVPLIRRYDTGEYNDLQSYLAAAGDLVLSDRRGGTVFYLTNSLDRLPVLVRINHDGYGWTSAFEGQTLRGLAEDPAYQRWQTRVEDYLTTGRADELYALRTPYIGNHIADGEILKALNVAAVTGPYTIELQTEQEPCGVTLHLERFPVSEDERLRTAGFLSQVGRLFVALVDNASAFHWDYVSQQTDGRIDALASGGIQPGIQKPVDRESFQTLYDQYRADLGAAAVPVMGTSTRYSLGETLYLAPEMQWRDMPSYNGSVTVAPDLFSIQMSHVLSSAWPQVEDTYANPVYRYEETPDRIVLKDDTWPTPKAVELFPALEQTAPVTRTGVLPLDSYADRSLLAVCDSGNQVTPYCLYLLDGELWLCRRSFTAEDGGTWKADWLFRLSGQPGLPLPVYEEE